MLDQVHLVIIIATLGCMVIVLSMCMHTCKRQTMEEREQEMFEKFKKKHIVQADRRKTVHLREQARVKNVLSKKHTKRRTNNNEATEQDAFLCSSCQHVVKPEQTQDSAIQVSIEERETAPSPARSYSQPSNRTASWKKDLSQSLASIAEENEDDLPESVHNEEGFTRTSTVTADKTRKPLLHKGSSTASSFGESRLLTPRPSLATYISFTHSLNTYFHSPSGVDSFYDDDSVSPGNMSAVFGNSMSEPSYIVPNRGPTIRVLKSSDASNNSSKGDEGTEREVTHGHNSTVIPLCHRDMSIDSMTSHTDDNPYESFSIDPAVAQNSKHSINTSDGNSYESMHMPNRYESVTSLAKLGNAGKVEAKNITSKFPIVKKSMSDDAYEPMDFSCGSNIGARNQPDVSQRTLKVDEEELSRYSPFPIRRRPSDALPSLPMVSVQAATPESTSGKEKVKYRPQPLRRLNVPRLSFFNEGDASQETYMSDVRNVNECSPTRPHAWFSAEGRRNLTPSTGNTQCLSQKRDSTSSKEAWNRRLSLLSRPSLPSLPEVFEDELNEYVMANSDMISTPIDRLIFDNSVFKTVYRETVV